MYENLRYELLKDGDVGVVTIDRRTARELADAWERLDYGEPTVGVLTGSGGTFCAGTDLKKMDLEDDGDGYLGVSSKRVSEPTIAAVEGY